MPGPGQQRLLDAQKKAAQKKEKAPAKKAAAKK